MTHDRRRQRGVVLPLLAFGMLTILGMVGLSVDLGHVFLNKTRLQNALDAAALSGARTLVLTSDVIAASADARAAFGEHAGLGVGAPGSDGLDLQYSDTLVPFVPGGSDPRYVRARVESFGTGLSFAAVLPNVGDTVLVGGSAVAGPAPVGYPGAVRTCDIAPLLVCGLPGDADCSDGACFGYRVGARVEYELGLGTGIDDALRAADGVAAASVRIGASPCGEGSAFYDCVPMSDETGGPGSFLLHDLGCAGAGCVRESLAGAFDACLSAGAGVEVETDRLPAPVIDGLMSRFGEGVSSLGPPEYPADVVATDRADDVDYWYDDYRSDVASVIAAGSGGDGVAYRRVLAVPAVSCRDDTAGSSANVVLGFLCLFLTRRVSGEEGAGKIYGQFVERCEASGERGATVPAMSGDYAGPIEIVLYRDPGSRDS